MDTPSASASIRGTEYSIVASDDYTTLTVVEGVVSFFNPQGRLEVREGQSAAARLGEVPTRIFTVNANSREQMLYYVSLDDAMRYLRPAAVRSGAASAAVDGVKGIAPADRTAEDWLSLAESGAGAEPRASIEEAVRQARRQSLGPAQEARAKLVEATLALNDRDHQGARQLFRDALPGLVGRQREVARFGSFVSETLADPLNTGIEPPELDEAEPMSFIGQAFLAAYVGDFEQARALAEAGLKRFPEESSFYAILGDIGQLTGDDKAMAETARQALLANPEDFFAYRMQAELELNYRGNPKAAITNARRAVELAPADDEAWNGLAQAYSVWGNGRKSEQAFLAGLAERPGSFILHADYALTLFQQGRVSEGREQLAVARSIDRGNALTSLIEGFLDLTSGRREQAFSHALDASAANPSYSEALLVLAEIHFARGEYALAAQQIDAADRADPNNPFVALYRAAFAIDSYRADDAIAAAREALRRYLARGGVYASLSESRGTGSYIAGAFRLLDLKEWARYYGDRTYDPFVSATLFDRALNSAPSPYLFRHGFLPFDPEFGGNAAIISDILQGIRLDPLSVAGSQKDLQLTRQKFVELTLAPSITASGNDVTLSSGVGLNGVLFDPAPLAFSITASRERLRLPLGTNNRQAGGSIEGLLGLKAGPYDNIVLAAGYTDQKTGLTGTVTAPRDNGRVHDRTASAIGVYTHQFDRENILSLGGGYLDQRRTLDRFDLVPVSVNPPITLGSQYRDDIRSRGWLASANYARGLDKAEFQLGGEYYAARLVQKLDIELTLPPFDPLIDTREQRFKVDRYRAYADFRFTPGNTLILQGQAAVAGIRIDGAANTNIDLSLGAALAPAEGHWLRAGFIRSSNIQLPFTLAPAAVVALRAAEAPAGDTMRSDSIVGRWEAEWSPHVFTSVEVQHQKFAGLTFEQANFIDPVDPLSLDQPIGVKSFDPGPSTLDRINASASFWLTGNVGIRTVYAYTDSKVKSGPGAGRAIPFASEHFARGQVTWTNGGRLKLSGGISFVGPRIVAADGTRDRQAWLADLQLSWEGFDKRVKATAGLFNALDERVLLAPGVPGFGRTFAASLNLRI